MAQSVPDMKLAEKCPQCGEPLILMESINMDTGELWLVKRCQKCHRFPVTEVIELAKIVSK